MYNRGPGQRWQRLRLTAGVLAAACLLAGAAAAQNRVQRIEEVRITGNRRIPQTTITYYIQSKANDPYNEQQILRDYRSLLGTDFFSDARVEIADGETGVIIIFTVQERPLVRGVEYEGMSSFKESDVLEAFRDQRVGLTVDSPFNESKLPKARKAIKSLLEGNGKPLGRVEVEVERVTSTSVRLIFKIDEGPKVRIGDIQFEGNTVFSDDELRGALELNKERGPITMFKGLDKYIPDKLEFDLQVNMMKLYQSRGYLYAKAGEPQVQIVEGPRGFLRGFRKTKQQYYIVVPIEEGEQFTVESFEVEGATVFTNQFLRLVYSVQPGAVFNWTALKGSNDIVKEQYTNIGYLDMDANPVITPDRDTRMVTITVKITEGKNYTVKRIEFAGNTKTRDRVLRREFLLEELTNFNSQLLDLSVLRLNQLGFFEPIEEKDYEVIKRPDVSEVDVVVTVKERSQQSIGLTGGVSGISGSFIGVNYSSNNFRGTGDRINVQVLTGTRTSNLNFSYTRPYFLGTRMSLGLSVFNQRNRFDTFAFFGLGGSSSNSITLFEQKTLGFTVSVSYPLARWTRVGIRYSLQNIQIDDVNDAFRPFAFNQLLALTPGGNIEDALDGLIRSEVTPSWTYNTKNGFFNATQGTQITAEVRLTGGPLGGDFNLVRPFVELQHFRRDHFLSGGRHVLAFRVRFQHIFPYGTTPAGEPQAPPFFERIFAGGEFDLRGFDIRQVSPFAFIRTAGRDLNGNPLIDPSTGLPLISEQIIPIGGDTMVVGTAEYRMPIAGPLSVAGFVDVGTSTILNKEDIRIFGPETIIDVLDGTNNVIRMSTGAELTFLLPVINQPFRLIFAYNPLRLDSEVTFQGIRFPLREPSSNFKFTVGYNF